VVSSGTTTLCHNDQLVARKVIFLDRFGYHSLIRRLNAHLQGPKC
jgi:hypothetical protein